MALMTLGITAEGRGMKTVATAGSHQLIMDEPPRLGGSDEGPNPLETLLSALAGCENVVANMIAKEMGISVESIDFSIKGQFDPRGLMGALDVCPYFQKVKIEAKVKTDATQEQINELQERTDARCPVYMTLKSVGNISLESEWIKA